MAVESHAGPRLLSEKKQKQPSPLVLPLGAKSPQQVPQGVPLA